MDNDKKIEENEKLENTKIKFKNAKKIIIVSLVEIGFLILIWSIYLFCLGSFDVPIYIIVVFLIVCVMTWGIYAYLKKVHIFEKEDENVLKQLMRKLDKKFSSIIEDKKVIHSTLTKIISVEPEAYQLLTGVKDFPILDRLTLMYHMCALEDKIVFFVSAPSDLDLIKKINIDNASEFSLDISQIVNYRFVGDKHYVSDVSGGGVSVGGAILGGLIAGGVGAIIGGTNGVSTEIKQIDERATIITYKDEELYKYLILDADAYDFLKIICPEKDEKVISMKLATSGESNSTTTTTKKTDDAISEIEKYYDLMQKGILTEEEFNDKKRGL